MSDYIEQNEIEPKCCGQDMRFNPDNGLYFCVFCGSNVDDPHWNQDSDQQDGDQSNIQELEARMEFLDSQLDKIRQCQVKVAACPNATQYVRIPNHYQTWKYGPFSLCKFCPGCLRKSPALSNPPADLLQTAPLWDSPKIEALREERQQKSNALFEERWKLNTQLSDLRREINNEKWQADYQAHLNSPLWKARRAKVMARSNGICEGCGNNRVQHVHHLSYDHMGDEFLFELVGVCLDCHQKLHPHRDIS